MEFIKITNKEIYDLTYDMKKENDKSHNEIIKHQLRTNGNVKKNKWIAGTALTVALGIGLAFITYLIESL